ncbi:MAG: methyl-accepting chemotaxis protein [Anaerofustis sp.]
MVNSNFDTDNEVLKAFELIAPYFDIIMDNEANLALANRTHYIANHTCPALRMKAGAGDPIPEGGSAWEAIHTGQICIKDVSAEVFGVPFKSYSIPVRNEDGTIEGAVSVGKSLQKRSEVLDCAQGLSSSLIQITSAVNELSDTVQNVVKTNTENIEFVNNTDQKAKETNEILNIVRKVSRQTHLLGINASIEAAKAGQYGKSFEVVANEIRSLSESVSNSMNRMEDVLGGISAAISEMKKRIEQSNDAISSQASTLEEIAASIESLNSTARELNNLSEKL